MLAHNELSHKRECDKVECSLKARTLTPKRLLRRSRFNYCDDKIPYCMSQNLMLNNYFDFYVTAE